MDPGRYVLQQGWDSNSALEGFGGVRDTEYRVGGLYGGRRYLDEAFPRDPVYARGSFNRELLEREHYPPGPPPVHGIWTSEIRRRSIHDELPLLRDTRRREKPLYLDGFHEADKFRDANRYREVESLHAVDKFRGADSYRDLDNYGDYVVDRGFRFGGHDHESFDAGEYDYRHKFVQSNRGESCERDYDASRYVDYDSDRDRSRRESNLRRRDSERERRTSTKDRNQTPEKRRRKRSRSHGYDDHPKSHSPRERIHGRGHKEGNHDEGPRESKDNKRTDWDDKRRQDHTPVAPSATLVVKGLSQKTLEDDLYQALAQWGPLRHVRVIKERNSGISRGFAFIDFPSVEAARKMMEGIGDDGLVVDGRRLFFEYSSKPTGGVVTVSENANKGSTHHGGKSNVPIADWMCTVCGCVNFARRVSCFQCNENKTDDAPVADVAASNATLSGKKGSEAGPTHVLVVRGLDEHADEEMLHYEFSKHAPLKDLRLVRDKFTHVSRGFAFIHFHSVEDATKALESTNGKPLEKNGQVLRVAYAKSIHGPSSSAVPSQSNSLAAAAIEAAAFAQQYDSVGWAPKEYNPDDKQQHEGANGASENLQENADDIKSSTAASQSAAQSGFVWDEASGYYYDAASGFYYDGHSGLYYDGNNGTWYSYDQDTHQYVPYVVQASGESNNNNLANNHGKGADGSTSRKSVISAPASTISLNYTESSEKKQSLADSVQAAEKKEREKAKEIKLASKNSILASKKKMNTVLNKWRQRNHEGQAARVVLDDVTTSSEDKLASIHVNSSSKSSAMPRVRSDTTDSSSQGLQSLGSGVGNPSGSTYVPPQSFTMPKSVPVSNSVGGTIRGVIRESTRLRTDQGASSSTGAAASSSLPQSAGAASSGVSECSILSGPSKMDITVSTPFKTDPSVLGSYGAPSVGTKRRFSETPQTGYRAVERRSVYGSAAATDPELQGSDGDRAGLGSQSDKRSDPPYQTYGDSYRGGIEKKALARFHEMK